MRFSKITKKIIIFLIRFLWKIGNLRRYFKLFTTLSKYLFQITHNLNRTHICLQHSNLGQNIF